LCASAETFARRRLNYLAPPGFEEAEGEEAEGGPYVLLVFFYILKHI